MKTEKWIIAVISVTAAIISFFAGLSLGRENLHEIEDRWYDGGYEDGYSDGYYDAYEEMEERSKEE